MTLSPRAIEAAARAIYEARNGKGCKPWSLQPKSHKEPYISDARAALTAALAVDGLCLVPKEPSVAMLAAGERAWIDDPLKRSSTLYRAMIAAASDGEERK